jgi:hypothetical protein
MTFASAITYYGVRGNKKVRKGTYTNTASGTGGDVDTGLTVCTDMVLIPGGATVNTNAPVVNETLPFAGSTITIVTDADATGYWEAEGY